MGCFVDRFLWRRAAMVSRRPSLTAISAAIVILSATLFAQPALQQPRTLPAADSGGATRNSRSVTVAHGDYAVYVVMKEPTPEKAKKGDPAPKVSLIKQSLTIPDLWNGELNTSSVIVAERIDPLPAP